MASSPMRKLRKTRAVDRDGNVVAIPRLPSVTGTHKPPGWNRWSAAEKVEHLLGMSLDRMHDYLSWPADGLDPYRLAAQTQVIRVVAMVAAKRSPCGHTCARARRHACPRSPASSASRPTDRAGVRGKPDRSRRVARNLRVRLRNREPILEKSPRLAQPRSAPWRSRPIGVGQRHRSVPADASVRCCSS
jgi:hypothetical protein